MKNAYIGGGVGNSYLPTPLHIKKKLFILNSLIKDTYIRIYYILYNKNYFYKGEIEKICNFRVDYYINKLLREGIIAEIKERTKYFDELYDIDGFNYRNVSIVKLYSLTEYGKIVLNPYKNYIFEYVKKEIREYINDFKAKIENKKQRLEAKYRIIKQKPRRYLTAEDLIFIQEYENLSRN